MSKESVPTAPSSEIVVPFIERDFTLDASRPADQWRKANPIAFCADWRGRNPDRDQETKVQALRSPRNLYLKFECRYHEIFVFEDSDPNGRRDHLWDRDVVEAFLQPDPTRQRYYREFEVSPNGMWVDLDIFPGGRRDLNSGLQHSVFRDDKSRTWTAELAIPLESLTAKFDPSAIWRANFYRVEGRKEPRTYLAWQATNTPEPNFHVPQAFGKLRFS